MRSIVAIALFLALPSLASAQGYVAVNQLKVIPLGGGDIEVIEARGDGARGMWCAAADYVVRQIGVTRGQRLYVKRARGPSLSGAGRIGVVFTTDAKALPVTPSQAVSVSVRTPGQGLPVRHAHQFCKDYEIDIDDILLRRGG